MNKDTIQWERMLPEEFRTAMANMPVLYLPLGTVEWHGEHNALGLDALKAHQLCVNAAKICGGIVHPPVYGGMGGLDKPATVIMEDELTWDNHLLRPWLEKLCSEFHRIGFKAIIMLTGHYGHNQQIVVREVAARMTERLQIPVFGTPEYWLALDEGYLGDHAGIGETSLLWHLHPDLVEIERIRSDLDYGMDDTIEKGSSPELGKVYADVITKRLAALAQSMIHWDEEKRAEFVQSEQTLIRQQLKGWRHIGPWEFWRHIAGSELVNYGDLLVKGEFDRIASLAQQIGAASAR